MNRVDKHLDKWRHNREFLKSIDDRYPDWMATVAFYAAVHAVEALFAFDNRPSSSNHTNRFDILRYNNRYKNIHKHFHPLYQAARTARYECDSTSWLPVESIKSELIPKHLYPLEKSVQKLIQAQGLLFEPVWPGG